MTTAPAPGIRRATPADAPVLHRLVRALAAYERLEHEVTGTAEDLAGALGGDPPLVHAFLASDGGGEAVGFALGYMTFSTFLSRAGFHIEDLFVVPQARGGGVGAALFAAVAGLAVERGCGRLEWDVLDWNEPAMGFYRRLGGRPVDDWTRWRLTGDALTAAAAAAGKPSGEPLS